MIWCKMPNLFPLYCGNVYRHCCVLERRELVLCGLFSLYCRKSCKVYYCYITKFRTSNAYIYVLLSGVSQVRGLVFEPQLCTNGFCFLCAQLALIEGKHREEWWPKNQQHIVSSIEDLLANTDPEIGQDSLFFLGPIALYGWC